VSKFKLSQPVRAWIYRVFVAAIPLLIAYGVISGQTAPLWVTLGATVLGFGMAAKNTSINPDE
jgi:hypothetical protein